MNENIKKQKRTPGKDVMDLELQLLDNETIEIYDLDKIDKIYYEIIKTNEKINILKQTSISNTPLEIEKSSLSTYTLKNKSKFFPKKRTLKMTNGDIFKGKAHIENDQFLYLENGIYTWKSGEKYEGGFNKNNNFEGKGKIIKTSKSESYIFESDFIDGFPVQNGIFKLSLKNLYDLYVQSNFKKNENINSPFKIILDGKTTITKNQGNEQVYRFDAILKNGKIKDFSTIQRKYKIKRNIEIKIKCEQNQFNNEKMTLKINDIKPGKTLDYGGIYQNGLIESYYIYDKLEKKSQEKKNINWEILIFSKLRKKFIKNYGRECFEELVTYKLKYIDLFNRKFKCNLKEGDNLIHIIHKDINLRYFTVLTRINFSNITELALNNSGITDLTPLEHANYPQLLILSLGKNKIVNIDSVNRFPFPKLQVIMLSFNKIKDITPLNQYKSSNLKTLSFIDNQINDITPLKYLYAPNLEQLTLGSNINNINIFTKCNFPNLKQLGLKKNKIKDISPIINFNFPKLEVLYFSNNQIVDISPFKKCNFPKLLNLTLDNNKIKNITPLLYIKGLNLNSLNISHNKFRPYSFENKENIEHLKRRVENLIY